ncbi:MAG: hypothetical protein FP814_15195 [Desulfobacterium sp.]|nr:hypothetical protein [Desulfobacterium sp.]MBU3950246.1 hypothetical protein [Pseudomonadota bacterium]MBU4011092.1 hypothetical protein [Pseudomonadota bacterium]MBU4035009.1 hypothetical protein [Pseudomonadota bacterium]
MFRKRKDNTCNDWIDSVLGKNNFSSIRSVNFNLYEGEGTFHLQIIGSNRTPEEDEEWYCDEDFTTGENVFIINRKVTGEKWEEGLNYFKNVLKEYIEKGKFNKVLKNMKAVGIGFVDGDDEIIYES